MNTDIEKTLREQFEKNVVLPESILPESISKKIADGKFDKKHLNVNVKKIIPIAAAAVFCVSLGIYSILGGNLLKRSDVTSHGQDSVSYSASGIESAPNVSDEASPSESAYPESGEDSGILSGQNANEAQKDLPSDSPATKQGEGDGADGESAYYEIQRLIYEAVEFIKTLG